jgi:hypothetical protein
MLNSISIMHLKNILVFYEKRSASDKPSAAAGLEDLWDTPNYLQRQIFLP